jgi:predicted DNA-binding transcriptional regulator YafY
MRQAMNRTERLMAILLELQARGELRASDLAARFEVSLRTIYRDLDGLAEGGVPLSGTPGKGYRLMAGYFLPPLTFTSTEAGVLLLGGEFMRARVDPELAQTADAALVKLAGVLPPAERARVDAWRGELAFPRRRRQVDDDVLGPLRGALEERRVVRLTYHAYRRPHPEVRDVEPISLIFLSDAWNLTAYCRVRQAVRFFRLDRIDDLTVRTERFTLGPRHAAQRNLDEWERRLEARVRFDPSVLRWVRERQYFTLVREEHDRDGPVFVYAMRAGDDGLLRWLLGWGLAAELLAPRELRAELAELAGRIASRYRTPAGEPARAADRTVSTARLHAGPGV